MDIFSSISSKTLSFDTHIDNNNIGVYGDASFSSYLKEKEGHSFIIRKLTDSTRYLKSPNTIPGSAGEDGEIGIFGAEKYFNGGMEDESSQRSNNSRNSPSHPSSQKLDKLILSHQHHNDMDEAFKPKPRLGTPSVGSESSSISSQRPLLKIVRNTTTTTTITNNNRAYNYSLQKRNNNHKSFLSNTLGYCICCSSKNKSAVEENEEVGEISFSNAVTANPSRNNNNNRLERETPSFRESHFSFPTAASSLKMVHLQEPEELGGRKSIEVFGSPVMGRLRNKQISLDKKLAMLSWDQTNKNSLGGTFYNEDEVNSDCSSDLFEIESLTKQTNPFHSPAASCYAPSEASVEWSVVTASALDFEERRPSTTSPARVVAPLMRVNNVNKEVVVVQKRRPSSLLGCKSEKAVRVAEDNKYKMNGKLNSDHLPMEPRSSKSLVAVKRFEDETKVGGFSFRSQGPLLPLTPPHRALAAHSLPRPYSPRLSNITFNIQ